MDEGSGQTQPPSNVDCPLPHNSTELSYLYRVRTLLISLSFLLIACWQIFYIQIVFLMRFSDLLYHQSLWFCWLAKKYFPRVKSPIKYFINNNLLTVLFNYLNYHFHLTTTFISLYHQVKSALSEELVCFYFLKSVFKKFNFIILN